ncbi:MAG: MATE family efflux transporter [Clostridiales bacterium]|jgi:putative MATE family efflux protein|nr:MATE family efflux transporter [Clostridiales bacterium]
MLSAVSKRNLNDMTEGVIWKQVLLFAVPIMLSYLLQQFYNTVDSIVVGQYVGKFALAAVGSTASTINLLIGFFVGLSAGAGVVISQAFGNRDYKSLHDAVHTAIALAILSGIVLGVIGVIAVPWILNLINTPEDVFGMAESYLRITFAGLIFTTIYNIGSGILMATGDSKRPLYYLAIGSVLNISLNLLFVITFNMGANGMAYATVIGQAVSAVLVMINLVRTTLPYKVTLKNIKIYWVQLKTIVRIGIPAGIQSIVVSLSNVIIQSYINSFGSTVMAGFTAASKINSFIYMPFSAVALAATTFVGQNVGAKKLDRVKKGIRTCVVMGAVAAIAAGWPAALFARPMVSLLNTDPEVVACASTIVRILSTFYFIFAIGEVLNGVIKGAGTSIPPMIISLSTMCVFRIIWLAILVPMTENVNVITICYPVSWACASVVFIIYALKGKWLKKHEEAIGMSEAKTIIN